MKIVQPVAKHSGCTCPVEDYSLTFDEYGLKEMSCPQHGPPFVIDQLEFDTKEEWEQWRATQ